MKGEPTTATITCFKLATRLLSFFQYLSYSWAVQCLGPQLLPAHSRFSLNLSQQNAALFPCPLPLSLLPVAVLWNPEPHQQRGGGLWPGWLASVVLLRTGTEM